MLPHIAVSKHNDLIRSIYFHQRWAIHDQYYLDLLTAGIEIEGTSQDWNEFREKPAIFCSFHIGSYRLILPYLLKHGIKVTLLIDEHVAKAQSEKFRELLNEVCDANKLTTDCVTIRDTSRGNIILSLLRDLKNGRSLPIFVDGNTGVGGSSPRDDSVSPVRFLGSTLFSRKGIGYISWMSDCSVVPMVIYRHEADAWTNVLKLFPPITPLRTRGREPFCADVIAGLYTVLEVSVREFYYQWESWRYIERSLDIPELAKRVPAPLAIAHNEESELRFNGNRYLLARHPEHHVLFDRASYRSTFISGGLCDFLESLTQSSKPAKILLKHPQMSASALNAMIQLGVIEAR